MKFILDNFTPTSQPFRTPFPQESKKQSPAWQGKPYRVGENHNFIPDVKKNGAGEGTWTPTVKPPDPKSGASANSATPAWPLYFTTIIYICQGENVFLQMVLISWLRWGAAEGKRYKTEWKPKPWYFDNGIRYSAKKFHSNFQIINKALLTEPISYDIMLNG